MHNDKNLFFGFTTAQWRLFVVVLVIGLSFVVFHILQGRNLNNTAALYIGLPLLFALGISLSPKAKTTTGATMKGLTIALFLSGPILMEGFICILFASPILYTIAGLVAWMADRIKSKKNNQTKVQLSAVVTILLFASLEGTPYELFSFGNRYQVSYTEVVDRGIDAVKDNLSYPTLTATDRPLFLRLFPFPVNVSGEGLQVGAEHRVDFIYKKWIVTNEHVGSTIFRVAEVNENSIRFEIPHDSSYLSHYMTWTNSAVSLEPLSASSTRIKWTLEFTRDLDPAWYFGPLQTYAAWLTAKVLVKNAAA